MATSVPKAMDAVYGVHGCVVVSLETAMYAEYGVHGCGSISTEGHEYLVWSAWVWQCHRRPCMLSMECMGVAVSVQKAMNA